MRSIVYERPRAFGVQEVPDPEPRSHEVRLRVLVTGVCGTDVHLHDGEFFPRYPLIPGHEIVGQVEAIGDEVDASLLGEIVALDNMVSCGSCPSCRRARPAFCSALRALGVTDPGGFADYVVAPAEKCHRAGEIEPDVAVFAEPTACAMHGLDVLEATPGSDVLVFGAGPSGLLLSQLLCHTGGARVTVAAPTRAKLDLALAYGIDEVVELDRKEPQNAETALRALAPDGFDIVVDATGAPQLLSEGIRLTRDGGSIFVYGMAAEDARLPVSPYEIFRRELTIKGSFSQSYSFDRAMLALRSGRVHTEGMITHRFRLEQYGAAIAAVDRDHACIKAVVIP